MPSLVSFQKTISCTFVNDIDARAAISRELVSVFTYEAFCMDFKAENEVFVNYIFLIDFVTQRITPEFWFDYIIKSNSLTALSYQRCKRVSNIRSQNKELRKFVSIEFSSSLMSVYRF